MAYQIRRLTVEQVAWAQWGHIAGSLSMAEILALLFWRELVIDPERPDWPERDRFVLSKAHCSPGLYAAMALRGFFPVSELYKYCEIDGILEGHSDTLRARRDWRRPAVCSAWGSQWRKGWLSAFASAATRVPGSIACSAMGS